MSPRQRERALSRRSALWGLDWWILGAVAILVVLGALLVWSATAQRLADGGADPSAFLRRHLLNATIGTVLGVLAASVEYRVLRAYALLVYVGACAGLLAVLSPLGATINGAHSWIVLPAGFQIQPSEFAKVALVVGLATLLGEVRERALSSRDLLGALVLGGIPIALILLQPDLGTVLVLVAIILGVLVGAGAPARWIAGLLLAGVVVCAGAVSMHVLDEYQVNRFAAFANPELDPRGVGYNTNQARIAIGAGGMWGTGLFEGSQTSGRFIPEQQTDFIFTVAGEELGLVGAGGIILLLGLVLWRGCRITANARDPFDRIIGAGVVSWFSFQVFVNIGMTLGIMPVTGLPLPFLSYGGSAMFANLVAVGLVQKVHLRNRAR